MLKSKLAKEMLENAFSVRDVAEELELPKGFIEKISKTIRREESAKGNPRIRYMNRPYEEALEKEDDNESLVDSGWIVKLRRKLLKQKIELDMMHEIGLLNDGNGHRQQIDIQRLLELRIVSGGEKSTAAELTAFATGLMPLVVASQKKETDDPISVFGKLQQIQTQGIEAYKSVQAQALAAAKSEADKGFVKEVVSKVASAAEPILKGFLNKPPAVPVPSPEIPGSMEIQQGALETLNLNEGQILATSGEATPPLDVGGYSNLRGKTIVERE